MDGITNAKEFRNTLTWIKATSGTRLRLHSAKGVDALGVEQSGRNKLTVD